MSANPRHPKTPNVRGAHSLDLMVGRSQIRAEYTRVKKMLCGMRPRNEGELREIYGAQQALAWVLQENAMIPSKCFGPIEKR